MLLFGKPIDLRGEDELLLLCARPGLSAQERERVVELLGDGVDGEYLAARARFHKIIPLLHRCLQQAPSVAVPPALADGIKRMFHTNALRNIGLEQTLVAVTGALANAQIPCLALKGPALARVVYGDSALRQSVDLDVLVARGDATKAWDALRASAHAEPDAGSLSYACLRFGSHFGLEYGARSTPVEVHWRVADSFFWLPFQTEPVFARSMQIALGDGAVRTPSPEDTLVLLAIHGASHCWERLGWVADVAALITSHADLDWAEILKQARQAHVERILALALLLARELLETELAESVTDWLKRVPATADLAEQAARNLLDSPSRILQGSRRVRFFAATRDTPGERMRFLAHRAFVPTERDWHVFDAPAALHFAYWLVRPFRLLRDAMSGRANRG